MVEERLPSKLLRKSVNDGAYVNKPQKVSEIQSAAEQRIHMPSE